MHVLDILSGLLLIVILATLLNTRTADCADAQYKHFYKPQVTHQHIKLNSDDIQRFSGTIIRTPIIQNLDYPDERFCPYIHSKHVLAHVH